MTAESSDLVQCAVQLRLLGRGIAHGGIEQIADRPQLGLDFDSRLRFARGERLRFRAIGFDLRVRFLE